MNQSITQGSDLEIIERTKNFGVALSQDYVDSVYYQYSVDWRYDTQLAITEAICKSEISDDELRTLALNSGSYAFWDDPCDDIYSLEDGEAV